MIDKIGIGRVLNLVEILRQRSPSIGN